MLLIFPNREYQKEENYLDLRYFGNKFENALSTNIEK